MLIAKPIPHGIKNRPAHPDQGRTIREARERLRLNQRELARRLGQTQQAISLLERGERCASGRTAYRLAEILEVPVPLPAIDPRETRQGRRVAAMAEAKVSLPPVDVATLDPYDFKKTLSRARRDQERQQRERIAQLVREVGELEHSERLRQTIWPAFRFGGRRF